MELERAFGLALKTHRVSAGLSQESFSVVSSRTYVSTLERGLKSPTLDKIDAIASVIGSHPLSILVSCYLRMDETLTIEELFLRIRHEVQNVKDGS